jgi:hypothetical protein
LPAGVASLKRIEGDGFRSDRILTLEQKKRLPSTGPSQFYYLNMVLSNPVIDEAGHPVIDEAGRPWVMVHDLLRGKAALYHADGGRWTGTPLHKVTRARHPGYAISHMSQLSRHGDGTLDVVLMVVPDDIPSHRYGAKGTGLVRILTDPVKQTSSCETVSLPERDGTADWQPSLQRPSWKLPKVAPALLWTRGINSHTLTERHTNVNDVRTEVWLQFSQPT